MPTRIRSTVKFEHIVQPFTSWWLYPIVTLSELIRVFNHFLYLANDPTRKVKHIGIPNGRLWDGRKSKKVG